MLASKKEDDSSETKAAKYVRLETLWWQNTVVTECCATRLSGDISRGRGEKEVQVKAKSPY